MFNIWTSGKTAVVSMFKHLFAKTRTKKGTFKVEKANKSMKN